MLDALISGRLRGAPSVRTSNAGKRFAIWRMAAYDRNGESVLCSCITFSATAIEIVEPMGDGDGIAAAGEASFKEWDGPDGTKRHGLDVLVHGVMTAYHVGRKRKGGDPIEGNNGRGML